MIGIDLTRISRFENVTSAFVAKMLHPSEIVEYEAVATKSAYLAARWAIKEALFKVNNALSSFSQVALTRENGVYRYAGYSISTSAEGDYYVAVVLREPHAA